VSSNVTLKNIAEALGISAMTVSRALNNRENVNEKTRQRVIEKARSMGYTPNHVAKSLVSSKTYTIGVVIPQITHSFFPEVVRGIEEVTYDSGYQLFLTNANEQASREKEAIQTFQSKQVDGMLISSSQTEEASSYYEDLINGGTKIVFFDRCVETIGASCISVNDRYSSKRITEHLIQKHNYKKIACLRGPQNVPIGYKRFEGFKDALQKHGLDLNKEWIIDAGFQEETGYQAMKELLSVSNDLYPEAVVCVNDPCAIGAICAIKEAGLSIPEDIAIVGFTDDIRAPLMSPPLTTIHQPAYEVGMRAAQKLIHTIQNEDEPAEYLEVATSMKVRSSCGCE